MAGLIYSLCILFIFQATEEEAYTPSLVGLMAEVNDPTSVYNNPGALGFINTRKKFQINLSEEAISQIRHSPSLQIDLRDKKFLSIYVFGFYFGVTSTWEGEAAIIAKRFGNFAAGLELRDNNLDLGTLLVISDKFRVAFASDIIYDPMEIHGRGGFIYQPLDWYYFGIDVFPHSRKLKIVNSFLEQRFGLDNISMGLEIDARNEDLNWDTFIQGVFSFEYLQLAVSWIWGVSNGPEGMEERSNFYGFNVICSLNFGF